MRSSEDLHRLGIEQQQFASHVRMNHALEFVAARTLHRKAECHAGIGIYEHSSHASPVREDSTRLDLRLNCLKNRRCKIMPRTIFMANRADCRGVQHQRA